MFVSEVLLDAAALLNDIPQANGWSNDVLLPHFRKAFKELVKKYETTGAPILNEVSVLTTVTAGTTSLSTITDIRIPLTLWERASGSSDTFTLMEETTWEPETDQSTELLYWSWREGAIVFLGATTNRQVKLKYIKTVEAPASYNSTLVFPEADVFLAARTAAIAAALSGGNLERAKALNDDAKEAMDELLNSQAQAQQGIPFRRKGYRV
jgi:hypothetical protein